MEEAKKMSYDTVVYKKEKGLGIVMLNRPESLNALSFKMKEELSAVFDEIEKDEDVKVVILTGGKKVFCAGADIKERASKQVSQPEAYFNQMKTHRLFCKIEDFEKPVIAVVSGVAVGGGCELTLVCDFRIASETSRFGFPEVKLGMIPAAGGTQRLPRIIGVTKAKELLYTGDFIDVEEAYRVGLVNKVVSVDELMAEAKVLALRLIKNPSLSVKFAKRAVNVGMQLNLTSALDYEAHCAALLVVSEDYLEGFKAFVEKRKPMFKGK
jgi:enoyl-CoA hydratase/carnithine racemase